MEVITSRQNPLCTHIRKLATSASYRRQHGEFLCDSPKLLEEVLLRGADLHTVVCTEDAALPPIPAGVRVVAVPADVMESLSPAKTPQGVLSVCGMPDRALPEILPGKRYVVLDGVQDPGNVGTILRTADALSADGLLLVNGCADLYHPNTLGSYLVASTLFAKIFNYDPTDIDFNYNLSKETAKTLRTIAKNAVFNTPEIPEEYLTSSEGVGK